MFIVTDPLSSIAKMCMDVFLSNNDTCADEYLKLFNRSIWGGPKKPTVQTRLDKAVNNKNCG